MNVMRELKALPEAYVLHRFTFSVDPFINIVSVVEGGGTAYMDDFNLVRLGK